MLKIARRASRVRSAAAGGTALALALAMVGIVHRTAPAQAEPAVTRLSINDASVTEGDGPGTTDMTFTITADQPVTTDEMVEYYTTDGTAVAPGDYAASTGTATIKPNPDPRVKPSTTVTIPIVGDTVAENKETFTVNLWNPATGPDPATNQTVAIGDGTGLGTINDNDIALSINDVTILEGDTPATTNAVFTITRAGPATDVLSVNYATAEGTATDPEDFTATSGTATFATMATTAQISVPVIGDNVDEANETFAVNLSAPVDTTTPSKTVNLADASGLGTITDDDVVTINVGDVTGPEGNSGTSNLGFPVTLSSPPAQDVSLDYDTADGSAEAGVDYTATSGTLVIPAGQTTGVIPVPVKGDTVVEPDENFALHISHPVNGTQGDADAVGSIANDDFPTISVGDAAVSEGEPGQTTKLVFTLTLSAPTQAPVSVHYDTVDGSAHAPSDYTAASGTVTFPANTTTRTVFVFVNGDDEAENDETMALALSGAVGAGGIARSSGVGRILDDGDGIIPTGYWMVGRDGGMFAFGDASFFGSTGGVPLAKPIVGMAMTPTGEGYWLVASDGGVFAFGDASFFGSTGAIRLVKPIVGIVSTVTGNGYWLVASDGGVFAFGDARFFGSTGAIQLAKPIVGGTASPSGKGYWLVASDGGVFAFGDAPFFGSTGNISLNQPIVGMAATPDGDGYWMVARDGGIFAFGHAPFFGSTGAIRLNQPIVGMAPTQFGDGYWLVASDGGIFAFGDAEFLGSTGGSRLAQPIVGMAGF